MIRRRRWRWRKSVAGTIRSLQLVRREERITDLLEILQHFRRAYAYQRERERRACSRIVQKVYRDAAEYYLSCWRYYLKELAALPPYGVCV